MTKRQHRWRTTGFVTLVVALGAAGCGTRGRRQAASRAAATSRRQRFASRRRSAAACSRCASPRATAYRPATSSRGSTLPTRARRCGGSQAERDQADAQLRLLQAGSRAEDIRQAARAGAVAQTRTCRPPQAELHAAEADLAALRGAAAVERRLAQAARRCADAAGRGGGARARPRASALARQPKRVARLRAGARPRGNRRRARPRRRRRRADCVAAEDRRRRRGHVARRRHRDVQAVDAGETVAPRTPLVVITDLDHAVGEPLRGRAGRAAAAARAAASHRDRRRPAPERHDHVHLAARRSSRRATCRPPKSARSSCTASK